MNEPAAPEKRPWAAWGSGDTIKAVLVVLLGAYILVGEGPRWRGGTTPDAPSPGRGEASSVEGFQGPSAALPTARDGDGADHPVASNPGPSVSSVRCGPIHGAGSDESASPIRLASRSSGPGSRPETSEEAEPTAAEREAAPPLAPAAPGECPPSWARPGLPVRPAGDVGH